MKKVFVFSLAAVLLFSCAKQEVVSQAHLSPETVPDPWTGTILEETPVEGGVQASVMAGFPETKVQLEMNGTGTYASLSWRAGDQFRMVALKGSSVGSSVYTTVEDGGNVAFEGSSLSNSGFGDTGFYCTSPASAYHGLGSYLEDYLLLVTLPRDQEAMAGAPDPDAMLSFAWAATDTEDFSFGNLVSLFKFRLTGANVANVKSITLRGVAPMSGNVPVGFDGSKRPQYLPGISFGNWSNNLYRYVTLTPTLGTFSADTDYYFAVLPGTSDGFTLTFELEVGGDSKTITKTSSKTLTMNRSRITDIGTVTVGTDYDSTTSLTPYMSATAVATKPVSLVVLSEGYRESELPQFRLDAKQGIDALFNTEPFKTYKNYFNVWFLEVASNESGARISDGTAEEQTRDCFFRSVWGNATYNNMEANADKVFAYVEDHCPDILDGTHTIEEVPVLLIINDTRYGGIAHSYGNGKTYCMVPKTYNGAAISWKYATNGKEAASDAPGSDETKDVTDEERIALGEADGSHIGNWTNTLVHEFGGHSFGRLYDEYWYNTSFTSQEAIPEHSFTVPFGLNVSGYWGTTPWDELLVPATHDSMVSSDSHYDRIGKFQGGGVSMFNRWRSEKISCMIDNRFYFSAWQRWLIVNRIMTLAGEAELNLTTFVSHDVTTDPLRDGGSPVMRPADGVANVTPPHPALPMVPPVMHVE